METRVDESLRGGREAGFGINEAFDVGDRVESLLSAQSLCVRYTCTSRVYVLSARTKICMVASTDQSVLVVMLNYLNRKSSHRKRVNILVNSSVYRCNVVRKFGSSDRVVSVWNDISAAGHAYYTEDLRRNLSSKTKPRAIFRRSRSLASLILPKPFLG